MKATSTYWPHILIVVLTVAAFYLRWDLNANTEVDEPVRADAVDYYFGAYNLMKFGVYSLHRQPADPSLHIEPKPTALSPPGYSLVISPFVEFPPSERMLSRVRMLQVILSTLVVILTFYALLPFIGAIASLLVGGLIAISPHLLSMNVYLLTESTYTFCLAVLVFLLSRWCRTHHWGYAALIGVAIALATLVRPTSLYLLIFIAPFFLPRMFNQDIARSSYLPLIALLVSFAVFYSPWVVRNNVTELAKTKSLSIDTIQKGMYPGLMYQGDPSTFGIPNRADPAFSVRGQSLSLVLEEIARRIKQEPGEYLRWYVLGKPLMYLSFDIIVGMGDVFVYPVRKTNLYSDPVLSTLRSLSRVLHWPITILALVMMMVIWLPSMKKKLRPDTLLMFRLLSVTLMYFIAVHVAGTPLPRYSIPIRPVVYSLSIGLLYVLFVTLRHRSTVGERKANPA